jgi:hypothetical protein
MYIDVFHFSQFKHFYYTKKQIKGFKKIKHNKIFISFINFTYKKSIGFDKTRLIDIDKLMIFNEV